MKIINIFYAFVSFLQVGLDERKSGDACMVASRFSAVMNAGQRQQLVQKYNVRAE